MAKRYRVLSLDGGGMRGIYTAAYLHGMMTRVRAGRLICPQACPRRPSAWLAPVRWGQGLRGFSCKVA
jgi:hypothetical protein